MEQIRLLNSLGDWLGIEAWLANMSEELNKHYRELRKDIRENCESWNYSQYCERFAYHYYNLAYHYKETLFNEIYNIDLESIQIYLEVCLEKLDEIPLEHYSEETTELKNDAEQFLSNVTKIRDNLETKKGTSPIGIHIALGSINQIQFERLSNANKQCIQNIQLLRVINVLENAISAPDHKITFIRAEQCDHLSQAYQLAGQYDIAMRYERTSNNIKKNLNVTKIYNDPKPKIKEIINREITKYKSNLGQVKSYIERQFGKSLSNIDHAYIQRKYLKYCGEFWLQETTLFLKKLAEDKCGAIIQEIHNSLEGIQSLSQVPSPLDNLEYYILLMGHYKMIGNYEKKLLICRWKKKCLEEIISYSESAEKELVLLEKLLQCLGCSENLQSIIAELDLKGFCMGHISLEELIENIMKLKVEIYGENIIALREAIEGLEQKRYLFFTHKFKEVIDAYIRPIKIQKRRIDDRLVVEVLGRNILVNQIIHRLEKAFSSNVKEVRFVKADIVHLDTSLQGELWAGMNVCVFAKTLCVCEQVIWDISGKNNNHTYSFGAGTNADGCGNQGADGYSGESGGNVLILTDRIEGQENFKIISNGGKGSEGQDGGNGRDGKDGRGISKGELIRLFPPCSMFVPEKRQDKLETILRNIKALAKHVYCDWPPGMLRNDMYSNMVKCNTMMPNNYLECWRKNFYFNVSTHQENEIIFSYEASSQIRNCQAFMLYKGSLGTNGQEGGEGGLGGEGGYPGEIKLMPLEGSREFDIMIEASAGKEGATGKGGLYGKHGKNGWDMAYMDYSWCVFKDWPVIFGENEDCKIEICYHATNSRDRVRCPFREHQCDRCYAEFVPSKMEHNSQRRYEERKRTRQNRQRQQHARAERKKHISHSSIFANYNLSLNMTEENVLHNLRFDIGQIKLQGLKESAELEEEQKCQITTLSGKHYFIYRNKKMERKVFLNSKSRTICRSSNKEEKNSHEFTEMTLRNIFIQLKELGFFQFRQLNQLFSTLDTLKSRYNKKSDICMLKYIEELFINKYRFATLLQIAKQLLPYEQVTDNINVPSINAERYLFEAEDNRNNISHPILGTLNQYMYETNQNHKIIQFCEKELYERNENLEILKLSLIAFISEAGAFEGAHTCVKKYYKDYVKYLENLTTYFELFKRELSQQRHADLHDLWIESFKNKSLKYKLEENIQKDMFLNSLYNRFNRQLQEEFNWGECCKDGAVLSEHKKHIQEKGLTSECYWELLANVFCVNIRLYTQEKDNKFYLVRDHNPLSKKSIYILSKNNTFKQLNIDINHLMLGEQRKRNGGHYAQILAETNLFNQKQEFDDYLKTKAYHKEHLSEMNSNVSFEEQEFTKEEDEDKIVEYFPEPDRQQLKGRLNKLTSAFIGRQTILPNIQKRFFTEGRHVSPQELHCLINSILHSVVSDDIDLNTYCWIISAYPQNFWMQELLLLQLENHFKRILTEKAEWRKYLSKIENTDILLQMKMSIDPGKADSSITAQCITDTLRLLSSIPSQTVSLDGLEIAEWQYALKEKYWTCKLANLVDWQADDLSIASYYLLSIENIFGSALAEMCMATIESKCKDKTVSSNTLVTILSNFHNETWHLSEEVLNGFSRCNIDEWMQKMRQNCTINEERRIMQLLELMKGNANTSQNILSQLPAIQMDIENIHKYITADNQPYIKYGREAEGEQDMENRMIEILVEIDRVIKLKRGFNFRDTQRLTVLALLRNKRSTLAQVSTGEGKSLIIVAVSIIKSLCGKKVDIITSSSVLAKRDAEANKDIYNWFGINVSHNCSEKIEKRREAYSGNQVIYGDLTNFERDYLLDQFYMKNILGDRDFQNVIVDEVDSMLLDKGNYILYLSHDLPGMDKLQSVYVYIWQWINRPARSQSEIANVFDSKAIKVAVLNGIFGVIEKRDLKQLASDLDEQEINIMWERLIQAEILDDKGKLLTSNVTDYELTKIVSPKFGYKDRLGYLINECIERERCIRVPNYLLPFVERHLERWIKSAITAFCMQAGEDYIVDVDKTGTSPDRNANIIILDRDTGTDQANSQWEEALHQFLQLKHGCKLSMQSLKAVFISNVSYLKLYTNLYGLTGTLGSQRERGLLQEIHGLDFVTIPTAKSKQFYEKNCIICASKDKWVECIYNEAIKLIKEEQRSILIICETVNDVGTFYKAFGGKNAKHVHTYTRDYEEFDNGFEVVQDSKKLGQGQIIIATNLAGRGTDIKITEGLKNAGGLHVCLTYLPDNIRIEEQAFGRAARSGDRGSGQLIIMGPNEQTISNLKIFDLKKERDAKELCRISDINNYYQIQITTEEMCFTTFKSQYASMKKDFDDKKVPIKVQETLLRGCLEKWVFWLDTHNEYISNLKTKQGREKIFVQLHNFISQLKTLKTGYEPSGKQNKYEYDGRSWDYWVEGNPIQMIELGKYLSQHGRPQNAIKLFDKVIKNEPHFSEAAHYYKAFALIKCKDCGQRVKHELEEAARLLNEHYNFVIIAGSITSYIKKNIDENIIQINAYEKQQEIIAKFYDIFSRSIDDIIGHNIHATSFINLDIKEGLSELIYKELLAGDILEKPRVVNDIAEKKLRIVSFNYGLPVEKLKGFLTKYKGKAIDENKFLKSMKEDINLPNRKSFWKLLIQTEVLKEEVKYVVLHNNRFKEMYPRLFDYLTEGINQGKLRRQTLKLEDEELVLNAEWFAQQTDNNESIFTKVDFIKFVGTEPYKELKEMGVVLVNKTAIINTRKIDSIHFPCYDSITLEDIIQVDISKSDAENILEELVRLNHIERNTCIKSNAYSLKVKFDEMKQIQLPNCPLFENVIKSLLSTCFAYRIGLQHIARQLDEKNLPIRLHLINDPHENLISELLAQKLIISATINKNDVDLEAEVKCIFENDAKLPDKNIIKRIVNILKGAKGALKSLETPDGELLPLPQYCGFANIEEVYVFTLNGLGELVKLAEMKWTNRMLLNTSVVIAMGVSQIAIGVCIQLYSMGVMTHVGNAFISEGVSDLFFAMGALKSGYFSWKDYGRHKLFSLLLTTLTVGVGAYFSKGVKVSSFGNKLIGPNLEIGGKEAAKMCGTELIKTVGTQQILKGVGKRIVIEAVKGLSLKFAHERVDWMVENYLQYLCNDIASNILSDIQREIEKHEISVTLKRAYGLLGERDAKQLMTELTNTVFTKQCYWDEFIHIANQIAASVGQGLNEATKKGGPSDNWLVTSIGYISKAVVWSERVAQIGKLLMITNTMLNNLNEEMKDRLNKLERNVESKHAQKGEENYEKFKTEIIDEWKSLICGKAGHIIAHHILNPLLKSGATTLIDCLGKTIKNKFQSYNESGYSAVFEKLKQEYKNNLEDLQSSENSSEIESKITENYHKELLELMYKTKNPKLLAAIVRENIPMDLTCVDACTQIIPKILAERGIAISDLTIIVKGDQDLKQEFSCKSDEGDRGCIIRLALTDNHFKVCGGSTSENDQNCNQNNDCLYEAIAEAIPGFKDIINAEEFRDEIANFIVNDERISYYIRQGWQRVPLRFNAFGGSKRRSHSSYKLSDVEEKSPYQHSNARGGWHFDESKDADLRKSELTNSEFNEQLADAYQLALDIMSKELSAEANKPISVAPGKFHATQYNTILIAKKFGDVGIASYPVEMEATIEVYVPSERKNVRYTLHIDLDNPVITPDLQGPHGPHVGYKIIPHNQKGSKRTGHILINQMENINIPHRTRTPKSVDDSELPKIPITRVFNGPVNRNKYLEKLDDEKIDRNAIRRRSYPRADF